MTWELVLLMLQMFNFARKQNVSNILKGREWSHWWIMPHIFFKFYIIANNVAVNISGYLPHILEKEISL